jgi:hypothetical protein
VDRGAVRQNLGEAANRRSSPGSVGAGTARTTCGASRTGGCDRYRVRESLTIRALGSRRDLGKRARSVPLSEVSSVKANTGGAQLGTDGAHLCGHAPSQRGLVRARAFLSGAFLSQYHAACPPSEP